MIPALPALRAQGCCVKRDEGSLFTIEISPPQRPLPQGAASHPYPCRAAARVRVERRGKSSPIGWRLSDAVNSIRSNTGMGAGGPTPEAGPAAPGVAGACRQRYVEIDDCQIQNPAYSLAHTKRGPGSRRDLFWCVRVQDQRSWTLLIPMAQGTPPGFPAHTPPFRCGGTPLLGFPCTRFLPVAKKRGPGTRRDLSFSIGSGTAG